jgi:carbon starvation protein
MIPVTLSAGYLNITRNYIPKELTLLAVLLAILMLLIVIAFIKPFRKWYELLRVKGPMSDKYGDMVLVVVEE